MSLDEIRIMFEENNALIGGTGMGGISVNSKDNTWSWKDLFPIMSNYATSDDTTIETSPSTSPTKKGIKANQSPPPPSKSLSSSSSTIKTTVSKDLFITKSNFIRLFGDNAWELSEK